MAKIKLRMGENEIEIESRDFYVDNQSIGEVIEKISKLLPQNNVQIETSDFVPEPPSLTNQDLGSSLDYLQAIDDVEIHEPEFNEPQSISTSEIRNKLLILARDSFFDEPRTTSETVSQLREYGWAASPLEVSKTLAKMAFNKEILKSSEENRSHYFAKDHPLLTN